ncbi:MAG: carbonic anhydrase [Proteiniphilum sp.]|uniref:carbonic anhydrase n=1 Tax=Proteiniphilum sp. TaxID=1926877 RepID=UPI002AB900DD|nr:carbonic anhydrase [Proteiniphilum sp.]MDY9918861.1 carbonic anhydrase [Proteiniphilum sp.]
MSDQEKYDRIFEANRKWIEKNKIENPGLFELLAAEQHPDFLYIGCSDSRVHPDQVMGLKPGEVFIHRNIANMVNSIDLNALSVINYGVEHLKVKYIIICGHYGCGGIQAAMGNLDYGILNPWLRSIRDVYRLHQTELNAIEDTEARYRRFVEINIYEQCRNVLKMAEVQKSYYKNGYPKVAGWVFDIADARLHDLHFDFEGELEKIREIYDITGEL